MNSSSLKSSVNRQIWQLTRGNPLGNVSKNAIASKREKLLRHASA